MSDPYGYSQTNDEARDDHRETRKARAQRPGAVSSNDQNLGMWIHMVAIISAFTLILGIVLTLIIWLMNKDDSEFVDKAGRESMNFQISILIYETVLVLSCILVITIPFAVIGLVVAWFAAIVLPVIAGLKANEGKNYQYPFTIRMF
jgi:uncharacterized protein